MSICWKWDGRHESAFASDRLTSHELLQSVILAFKDMHFSYNLAPKHKPVTSSGAEPEKQPLWVILAEYDFSCSLWPQISTWDKTLLLFCKTKPLLGAYEWCHMAPACLQTYLSPWGKWNPTTDTLDTHHGLARGRRGLCIFSLFHTVF